ncbi:hypothetical protein SZ64_10560 [Erythrobacter sp. SG61-1L]|uniref:hypothetical protein n=1 Tax=Erythrobacter sp. SG61-1L TaxID=1603897 RepID=UPI0006C9218F|nr:hypothetical protein [Erythrobacter sp. SG61-1L]KPL68505.1 hypothetical protein SZ64_10560 [Erythrobacter sp. SG61-1L]
MLDRTSSGAGKRLLLFFLGWLLSAFIGWQILTSSADGAGLIIGLAFLLGLPVFLFGGLLEYQRRKLIEDEVFADPQARSGPDESARRPGETVEAWTERCRPNMDPGGRRLWDAYAKHCPPRVGQSMADWIKNWPDWNPDWDPIKEVAGERFNEGDTLTSWAERIARSFSRATGKDFEFLQDALLSMAFYAKPKVGETYDAFEARSKARIAQLQASLEATASSSAIRADETPSQWIERVILLLTMIEPGVSLDDLIPTFTRWASTYPPMQGETANSWQERIQRNLAEAAKDSR